MNTSTQRNMISKAALSLSLALLPANVAMAAAAPADNGGGLVQLMPLILIMVIFWVLLIRPQQKRMKEHAEIIKNLKKGDKIITGGGLLGRITQIKDGIATVEVADGVQVRIKQDTIAGLQELPQKTEAKKTKKS